MTADDRYFMAGLLLGAVLIAGIACAVEDAGFEIRDTIMYIYGSGFPKSLDVSKAIDKAAGATREVVGVKAGDPLRFKKFKEQDGNERITFGADLTAPATPDATRWQGWGTALKPAFEPIVVARKPLIGTVAANVLKHGTGALNIDGCRVGTDGGTAKGTFPKGESSGVFGDGINGACEIVELGKGRWPANLIHDGSDEVLAGFPETKSGGGNLGNTKDGIGMFGNGKAFDGGTYVANSGSAARFFYCAKASAYDRNDGTYDMPPRFAPTMGNGIGGKEHDPETATKKGNHHPTVKPTNLMRYLVRLVTPPGGIVLDPFMGSGSTGKAAVLEGFNFTGIELDVEYIEIARARIAHALQSDKQQTLAL